MPKFPKFGNFLCKILPSSTPLHGDKKHVKKLPIDVAKTTELSSNLGYQIHTCLHVNWNLNRKHTGNFCDIFSCLSGYKMFRESRNKTIREQFGNNSESSSNLEVHNRTFLLPNWKKNLPYKFTFLLLIYAQFGRKIFHTSYIKKLTQILTQNLTENV